MARAFLPDRPWGNRSRYYYVRAKLASDPLYHGVLQQLPQDALPVLDLGCGLGLLGHVMRQQGRATPYLGVDMDAGKITQASAAARRAGLGAVDFQRQDLQQPLPGHAGHVTILDVIQYLHADAQVRLLQAAAQRVPSGARLLLRTPLDTGDGRDRTTRITDRLGWLSGWMHTRPRHYPSPAVLVSVLEDAGLRAQAPTPLHGRTPFNSWLMVAER